MKTILALLFSLSVPLSASRPLLDMRDVVGVVPRAEGIDVYWQRTNEFETPVRPRLMRTTASADGTSRLSRVLIHEFEDGSASVGGQGNNVQAIWTTYAGSIMASPIVNGALKYPEGKLVSPFGSYPAVTCHATECAVIYTFGGGPRATLLDADSNVASSFPLPDGFHPQGVSFSERGLFFVRHQSNQVRAALVRRNGIVQYDVAIADAEPRAFHAGPLAIVRHATEHVVAFVDYAPEPDEVHAIAVSDEGATSEPVRLLRTERHPDLPANVASLSLAWNGTAYLLGGGYVIGAPFLLRFDSELRPLDAAPQSGGGIPWVTVHADGERFVIVWPGPRPYLTVLSPNGEMSPRLELDPMPRRRAVR